MRNRKTQRLKTLQRLAERLSEQLDDVNEKLANTANALASIQDAYQQLPHPADLEGLAGVAERIFYAPDAAQDSCEVLPHQT